MPFPTTTNPDTEVQALLDAEVERQTTGLQLIASENFTSPAVMAATGSVLTNKYAEGYPGKRYYGGNAVVDSIEQLAIDRVKELFGAEHANVQPHSGANANMCVYQALLEPGDTILGLSLDHGGHLTHGSPVNASGLLYNFVAYGTGAEDRIDMDNVRELALEHRPKMIVAGTTSYPRRLDPEPFKKIADEVGALLMSTSRTSLVWSPVVLIPTRFRSRTWSRSPRTRRCVARAAVASCRKRSTQPQSTRPCSRVGKAVRSNTQLLARRLRSAKQWTRRSPSTRHRLWRMRRRSRTRWPMRASDWCRVVPITT